jgi:hypothetical protein
MLTFFAPKKLISTPHLPGNFSDTAVWRDSHIELCRRRVIRRGTLIFKCSRSSDSEEETKGQSMSDSLSVCRVSPTSLGNMHDHRSLLRNNGDRSHCWNTCTTLGTEVIVEAQYYSTMTSNNITVTMTSDNFWDTFLRNNEYDHTQQ